MCFFEGELQKYAKNSNFENFESTLNLTSVSMPLNPNIGHSWYHTTLGNNSVFALCQNVLLKGIHQHG